MGDPTLSRQIRAEYERMRQEDIVTRVQPLMTYFESQRTVFETHFLLPSVTATLSKGETLALAGRDDVQTIYLVEGETEPELDTAVHTNRVMPVWSALGIDGELEPTIPITIAIVEQGNVDWDNSFLHHASIRRVAPNGEQDHTTRVASDAASFHDIYRGMAPGATILSAGHDGSMSGAHFALNWALDQDADVVNMSEGFPNDTPDLEWIDTAFDYTARIRGATIIKSAGNRRNEYITAPGKGWNVVTVGGINDQGTTTWSDDVMWTEGITGSSYLDPGDGDRKKPEVAAPGQDITAIGLNDIPRTRSGTSHAAPQVAGLAALLIHRNPDVEQYPTAVKAILMASAVHNIEGDSRLSDEDGAGSIDAALADAIVQTHQDDGVTCSGPCWWAIETEEDYPDPGDWLYQHFTASRGERIRVAIAWWSEADPPPAYPTLGDDALTSNFNLYVWSPSGGLPGYSASWDNNYEIVEFIAPETGIYEIGAFKDENTTTEEENELGIAWVRDATCLPDLRRESGWVSEFYVRNDGARFRDVTIHYFNSSGNPTPKVSDTCRLFPGEQCPISVDHDNRIPNNSTGSAIVGGGEDVSVVVKNRRSGGITSYSGIGAQGSGAGWDEPGQTAYVPASLRDYYGWDSVFYIQNTGSGGASGSITFYNGDGTPKHTEPDLSISTNGQEIVNLYSVEELGDNFSGSAVISFDQPVAVVVRQDGGSSGYSDFNAFTSGADVLYLPSLLNGYYGWDSAYQIQNVGTQDATVTVRYEFEGSSCIRSLGTVKAKGYAMVYQPTDPCFAGKTIGSARVTSGSNRPIVAIVNQQNSTGSHQSYSALLGGATTLFAPFFAHDVGGWNSSLQVQNMDSDTADVWRTYYETDGNQALSTGPDSLAPRKSKAWIGGEGVPSGYYYSAVVTSDRQVGGICNTSRSGGGDIGCSYNMIAR